MDRLGNLLADILESVIVGGSIGVIIAIIIGFIALSKVFFEEFKNNFPILSMIVTVIIFLGIASFAFNIIMSIPDMMGVAQ